MNYIGFETYYKNLGDRLYVNAMNFLNSFDDEKLAEFSKKNFENVDTETLVKNAEETKFYIDMDDSCDGSWSRNMDKNKNYFDIANARKNGTYVSISDFIQSEKERIKPMYEDEFAKRNTVYTFDYKDVFSHIVYKFDNYKGKYRNNIEISNIGEIVPQNMRKEYISSGEISREKNLEKVIDEVIKELIDINFKSTLIDLIRIDSIEIDKLPKRECDFKYHISFFNDKYRLTKYGFYASVKFDFSNLTDCKVNVATYTNAGKLSGEYGERFTNEIYSEWVDAYDYENAYEKLVTDNEYDFEKYVMDNLMFKSVYKTIIR